MTKWSFKFCSVVVLSIICVGTIRAQSADLVLINGRVWTADSKRPWANAIAIGANKIIAVGTTTAIRRLERPGTKVIDLAGRFVMPGINDAHIHFLGGSLAAMQVDLNEAKSLADVQDRLRKFAADKPQGEWITGFGWQYNIFPGGLPDRAGIDAAIADRPVYLRAYDGHTAWANSKALEIAGVNSTTKFEGFGEIVQDKNGNPTGVLKEGAMGLVSRYVPRPSREAELDALRRGFKAAAALGITSIQNAHGSIGEIEIYDELLKKRELTLRTSFAFTTGPSTKQADIDRIIAAGNKYDSPMLKAKAIKIAVDGVIESYTAAMIRPYSNRTDTAGKAIFTQDQLNELVQMADKVGLQIYIHAIGDRGVRMALDAFENAIRVNGRRDSRFRIEHIETIQPEDIARFKKLRVIASMEPIHADPGTIGVWSDAIGPERTRRGFAWRSLEKAGARLVFSSDYPAALSMSPWRGLHNAVNRQTVDGKPIGGWLPQQRVSIDTALRAYTSNGAYASFTEGQKGRVSTGMLADIIVLEQDPFAVATADLHKLKVRYTIFDGSVIYDSKMAN